MKKIGYGHGHGKVILFGEHFVVHGYQALVLSLPQKTLAEVCLSKAGELTIVDNRPKVPNFKLTKTEEYLQMVKNICKYFGVDDSLQITLSGDLVVTSGGIGASAAASVAIARAINDLFNCGASEKNLMSAALEGERAVHGNPSGIDTTAAMFNGTFIFKRGDPSIHPAFAEATAGTQDERQKPARGEFERGESIEPSPEWRRVEIPITLFSHMMLVDSGIPANTKAVISVVAEKLKDEAQKTKQLFDSYSDLFETVLSAIKKNDRKLFISRLNKNHELLSDLGVSCPKLEEIRKLAFDAGAVAAKITGTGQGGLVLVATDSVAVQTNVEAELQKKGLSVFKIS